jgi:hypothetical protein
MPKDAHNKPPDNTKMLLSRIEPPLSTMEKEITQPVRNTSQPPIRTLGKPTRLLNPPTCRNRFNASGRLEARRRFGSAVPDSSPEPC